MSINIFESIVILIIAQVCKYNIEIKFKFPQVLQLKFNFFRKTFA